MTGQRLQLVPDGWYGWQMVPGYGGVRNVPYFSPIRVTQVTPKKTGKKILTLSFINVLYAEGVQDFTLDMRILKHEPDYLIAELLYDAPGQEGRAAVVSHIEFEWIRRMCPGLWSERPPETLSSAAQTSVSIYLDEIFGS
jgi:hypothetical protein